MSMEQAILEHAGALRELAAAIKSMGAQVSISGALSTIANAPADQIISAVEQKKETIADTVEIAKDKITKQRAERDADQQAAGVCPEAAEDASKLRGTTAEDAAADQIPGKKDRDGAAPDKSAPAAVEPDAELEAAVSKVEEESKVLDYKKDMYPLLMKVAKKDRELLVGLLKKYGVPNAQKLTEDQYPAVFADANALIAG